jgi:hypothetical protein
VGAVLKDHTSIVAVTPPERCVGPDLNFRPGEAVTTFKPAVASPPSLSFGQCDAWDRI